MELKDFKPNQQIKFWSERVFGVPVHAIVEGVGRKYLKVTAFYPGLTKRDVKIYPSRVCKIKTELGTFIDI